MLPPPGCLPTRIKGFYDLHKKFLFPPTRALLPQRVGPQEYIYPITLNPVASTAPQQCIPLCQNNYIPVVRRAVSESWSTSNGTFKTKKVGDVKLSFVEYFASKKVHLYPDIVEHPQGSPWPLYDLIIGKQTLHDIGTVLDFKEMTITIDEILLPMRNINNLQLKPSISRVFKINSSFAQEPVSTRNTTKRVVEILDAKYDKADLPCIVKNDCPHLSMPHRNSLLTLLLKFEKFFDSMLGDWKLLPVSFALKEGAKPYHGRPYPIPKIHKATLIKEIDRLVAIGVLKWQPLSKWASPSFIIPKKNHIVRTISDFRDLDKPILRKSYPASKSVPLCRSWKASHMQPA
jgi:hypothetical protein